MALPNLSPSSEASVAQLIDRAQPRLRRVLFRFRVPTQDAEDLLQETFLILISKWETLSNPEAWLVATLANRCIIYWRKRRSRLWDLVDSTVLELLADSGAAQQDNLDLRADLESLIATLPTRCQRLLRLRFGLGCSTAETAEQLGYCRSSVRKVTHRCVASLAERLLGLSEAKPRVAKVRIRRAPKIPS